MRLPHIIFFLSGIAGLGYEIVWTRMFAFGLGHEMSSLLAVVAAFFGGLALGAWALDGVVSRSRHPGRWYVGCELVIGAWALATSFLIPMLNTLATTAIGVEGPAWRHSFFALAIPFFGLLPATCAMGVTFPAMERLVARLAGRGERIAGLYAANTAGAVAGTLLATFVVVPAIGFRGTLFALAALNFICAAAAAFGPAVGEAQRKSVTHELTGAPSPLRLGVTLAMTGFLGIGYQVLGVRVMAQVHENTIFSFASALSVFLAGTAIGAASYQRFARKRAFGPPLVWLLQWLTVACLFGIVILPASGRIYESARLAMGGDALASVAAEMLLAAIVFLPATVAMGATFGHLVQASRGASGGVGRALGLNTFGASLAPVVFGMGLMPWIGAKWALVGIAVGYLPLVPFASILPRRVAPAVLAALLATVLPTDLELVDAPLGTRVVEYRDGTMAAVAVLDDGRGGRLLKVNNRFSMGGTGNSFADQRQAHIPLLLHPDPRRVLFLGVGTGITAGTATTHGVGVWAVELIPEVMDLLPAFAPTNRVQALADGQLVVADARRFVRSSGETFDVIVADLFHPARDGAGTLYTVEHFEAIRSRLADGGVFCQWLPLYQLDIDVARLIVRTFLHVFPETTAYIAHFNVDTPTLGLVGREIPTTYPANWYASRVGDDARLAAAIETVAIERNITLFGSLLGSRADLHTFAGEGPLNSDDHPRVMFETPSFTYRKVEQGHGILSALLEAWNPRASDVVAGDAGFARRLDDYLAARNAYLGGMILLREGSVVEGIDAILGSVQRSADFRTGYVICLQEAISRARQNPDLSRRILDELIAMRPEDGRALEYRRKLFGR